MTCQPPSQSDVQDEQAHSSEDSVEPPVPALGQSIATIDHNTISTPTESTSTLTCSLLQHDGVLVDLQVADQQCRLVSSPELFPV